MTGWQAARRRWAALDARAFENADAKLWRQRVARVAHIFGCPSCYRGVECPDCPQVEAQT